MNVMINMWYFERFLNIIPGMLLVFALGVWLYYPYYKGRSKPKYGVKRETIGGYVNDVVNLKNYWGGICSLFMAGLLFISAIVYLILSFVY